MLENLSTTHILASLIGLYFVAAGLGLLSERDGISKMFRELSDQPMLGYLAGVIAFAIGGAIVSVHNNWSDLLSGFVSFIGWAALAEGVLVLACRKWFLAALERVTLSVRFVTGMGFATLAIGLVLLATVFVL